MGSEAKELRFALAMNGGVSLAVWIGGVCDELLRLVRAGEVVEPRDGDGVLPPSDGVAVSSPSTEDFRVTVWSGRMRAKPLFRVRVRKEVEPSDGVAVSPPSNDNAMPEPNDWRDPYQVLCYCTNLKPRVDVMTGASAGGMNGVFLALGLTYKHANLDRLRDLWIEQGSFSKLLRDPLDTAPPSLLRGDGYFLPRLQDAVRVLAQGDHHPTGDMPIDLQLTITTVEGFPEIVLDRDGTALPERRHNYTLRFLRNEKRDDFVAGENEQAALVGRLARACRTTASFPGAFEPSLIQVAPDDPPDSNPAVGDKPAVDAFTKDQLGGLKQSAYAIDGGVLVNLPVSEAIEAIFDQDSPRPVERIFAMVVPDPTLEITTPASSPSEPALSRIVAGSLTSIPRNVRVNGFLEELERHNRVFEMTREARLGLLRERTLTEVVDVGTQLLPAYLAARRAGGMNWLSRKMSTTWAEHPLDAPADRQLWIQALDQLQELPWIPPDLGVGNSGHWGWSTVRRSAARVLHILDWSRASTPARREAVYTVLRKLKRKDPSFANVDWSAVGAQVGVELRNALSVNQDNLTLARRGAMTELSRVLAEVSGALVGSDFELMAMTDNVEEMTALLLSLEVIENSFGSFDQRLEQTVEVLRVDSVSTCPIDSGNRTRAAGKVAGVQLGHFGSFLQATWRANDWMWGRLDGAGDLVKTMIDHRDKEVFDARVATALIHREEWTGSDEEGEDNPVLLRKLLHERLAADIVLDERRTLEKAIQIDRDGHSLATDSTRAVQQVLKVPLPPDACLPAQTAYAKQLLSACRFGEESIKDQLGGDMLTSLSAQAVATSATVLRSGGPKLLRAPIIVVRYVALMVWGLLHGSIGGEVSRTAAALAFGAGTGIVAIQSFTDFDMKAVYPIGLLLFIGGVLIGFARAPIIAFLFLAVAALPHALLWASEATAPGYYPKNWWWPPGEWAVEGDWVKPVAFIAAAVLIGSIRRPRWMQISAGRRERSVFLLERHSNWVQPRG